jgi:AraC-like DNA-binding protein
LLGNPKFSIKEIGFELGFKTSSHFIAAFRREFAVSPQEYRQQSAGGGACYTSVKTVAEISRPPRKDAGKTIPRFLEPVAWPPSEWRP